MAQAAILHPHPRPIRHALSRISKLFTLRVGVFSCDICLWSVCIFGFGDGGAAEAFPGGDGWDQGFGEGG